MGGDITREELNKVTQLVKDSEPKVETTRFPGVLQGHTISAHRHSNRHVLRETETVMSDGTSFSETLKKMLNRYQEESKSNTPDFILATYMVNCLDAFNNAIVRREQWYGRDI